MIAMDEKRKQMYAALMDQGIGEVPVEAAIERIGLLIDLSGDLHQDEGLSRSLERCDQLEKRGISTSQGALLEYFRANAWGYRQDQKHRDMGGVWSWEQPELQHQILHLRSAINHPGFKELETLRRCQIFTNLANQMNTVGRFVEALEYWDRALSLDPNFGMALGNRGCGLERYAAALYDPGHQGVLLAFALRSLTVALSPNAEYGGLGYDPAKDFFRDVKKRIESLIESANLLRDIDLDDGLKDRTAEERHYRKWSLQNRLFLNPLNDLGSHAIAARDVLVLPSFVTSIKEPPTLVGFFNQMKQEYVSARWLLYEGTHATEVHFSDRDVLLYNTLDYPSYALSVEKSKAAYRIAYSLLDKIGFFINAYLALGIASKNVNFRTIWYQNYDKQVLRAEFERYENWPLRGLFWLSKDLFDDMLADVTEPDAQALHAIRNHLEHKYLKVHEMLLPPTAAVGSWWVDSLAYSVQRKDFEAKTLRLLKLSRAALTYLSLGMHSEERRRRKGQGNKLLAAMPLDVWDDDWKH